MPLYVCPDCRQNVSDAAPVCTHCGRPRNAGYPGRARRTGMGAGGIAAIVIGSLVFLGIVIGVGSSVYTSMVAARRMDQLKAQDARFREMEQSRSQKIGELAETTQLAEARVMADKAAFIALLAMQNGAATAFEENAGEGVKAISVAAGLFAAGYCLENQEECSSLASDLQANEAHQKRLREEIGSLSQEAGHRVVLSNSCKQAVTFSLTYRDLLLGSDTSGQWKIEGETNNYPTSEGFYLRSQDGAGEFTVRISSDESATPAPAQTKLNEKSDWVIAASCN